MKNIYSYLFFRIYIWNKFLWKNRKMAAFNSSLAISFSIFSFFMSVILIVERLIEVKIYNLENFWYFALAVFLIIFFNHYYFERSQYFLKIENKFSHKKNTSWYAKGVVVWIFLLGSIFTFIFLL